MISLRIRSQSFASSDVSHSYKRFKRNARLQTSFRHIFSLILVFAAAQLVMVNAATLPSGFAETQVVSGLSNPTAMAFAPDGRIFVTLQGGQLRVVKNGALLPTPFLSLTVDSQGERGLLGVAFDPNFTANQYVYVYYTATTPTVHNRVSRFTANGDVMLAGSETVLLDLDNLSGATNHNGGAMHFGADGKLYIAVGENANGANAQTLANLLGKILRMNADGSIPTDNPFYTTASGKNRLIWSLGLRNPFTFAFQNGTGRMFINDVGQSTYEEINDGVAGSNYGWSLIEGKRTTQTPPANYRDPLHVFGHYGGALPVQGCAITGGAFYNPARQQFPAEYNGTYFFADFCSNFIRRIDPNNPDASIAFATGLSSPVDLAVDADGSLYYLQRGNGALYKIEYTASQVPSIGTQPTSQTVSAGGSVTFTVTANGAPTLTYQWQRKNSGATTFTNIAGATSASYTLTNASAADNNAQFRVVVTNSSGTATSNAATLTVTANQAPTATIITPAQGTLYSGGETISYSGTGTDPEQGDLPASAFTWRVDFQHDTHAHPFIAPTSGAKSGTFVIPTTGETAANVFYRIYLTVTDAGGLTSTVTRDILPRKSTITLQTSPGGLQLTLDGQPVANGTAVESVVGVKRMIGVASPQVLNGVTYDFSSWSDAGAQTHEISTPTTNTTYTATFTVRTSATQLQFAQATYAVNESAGVATITVTRTGDTGTAVSVDYRTDDPAQLFNCDPASAGHPAGTASSRCDYTTSVGKLSFAAGETSKTFTVIINNDTHVEPIETFRISLVNPTNAVVGAAATTTVSITDNDTASTPNPINGNDFFVRQQYIDFFGRTPSQAEVDSWLAVMQPDCGVSGNCYDRLYVAGVGFFRSQEFQQKGYFAYRFYKAALGRLPTYNEFIPDLVSIKGTTDADKNAFAQSFSARQEFTAIYNGTTNQAFVDEMQRRAGVTLPNAAQLVADLNANTKTRAEVLRIVVESQQVYDKNFNEGYVVMSYFGFLRRDGAASEYNAWLQVINRDPNDYRTMTNGFVNSIEYRNRFGRP